MQKDLVIPENIVTEELIRTPDTKIADHMTFGMPDVSPIGAPDLTLRTRVRGDDWIYTYLRTFYEDSSQTSGSNNLVYVGTAMPNVLAGLQGNQALDKDGKLIQVSEGSLSKEEFVIKLTENLPAPPSYFPYNVKLNQQGYEDLDVVISKNLNPLKYKDFQESKFKNVVLLDCRSPKSFYKGFIKGSINIG